MTSVSSSLSTREAGSSRALHTVAPFLLALLGTVGGFLVAELVRRVRGGDVQLAQPAPSGRLGIDFSAVRMAGAPEPEEPAYAFEPEAIVTLPDDLRPAAGIRPTFDVEAELARALEAMPEPAIVR